MIEKFLPALRLLRRMLCIGCLSLLSVPAQAGNIGFGLALTDSKLAITNQGNSSAFYPAAFRLTADGTWQQLALAPGARQPAELAAGAQIEFLWPDTRPPAALPPLEALRPVMVRFFDQAGAGFGQISFFNQPLGAEQTLEAGYVDGKMKIAPPDGKTDAAGNPIRATWLVWGREDGIAPLRGAVEFRHVQPAAQRIEWKAGTQAQEFDLGKGLPVVFLLHETAQGLRLQVVYGGNVQGRQQRAAWLDRNPLFYNLALWTGAAGLAALLWHLIAAARRRAAA